MGRIAKGKLRRAGILPRLIRGQAQALPFSDEAFAAVISAFPTDFIVAPETLREVNRVLAPGGSFIIVPNGILTGRGVTSAGIEWLYRITGQRAGNLTGLSEFFGRYGFDVHLVEEPCPRSLAQVIIARKKGLVTPQSA
jgi:ubiquinone/menaquinone biosynthesis C-methylase UbiE